MTTWGEKRETARGLDREEGGGEKEEKKEKEMVFKFHIFSDFFFGFF